MSRDEFWLAAAINGIILSLLLVAAYIILFLVGDSYMAQLLRGSVWRLCDWIGLAACGQQPSEWVALYLVAAFVPIVTIQIRRFRDAGVNSLLLLAWFIPYIGVPIIFFLLLRPSRSLST